MNRSLLAAACTASLFACATEPSEPTASVTLRNRDRVPLAGWPVVFHGADGRVLDVTFTTDGGVATGPMEPNGMVTYDAPFLEKRLITHGQVQPGDRLANAETLDPEAELEQRLLVVTPKLPGARLSRIVVPCGAQAITTRGVPGTAITVDLPKGCAPADASGGRSVYLLATATDERAEVIAYASLDPLTVTTSPARVTIDQWHTDLVEIPVTFAGLDPDLVHYRLDVQTFVGAALVSWFIRDGDGPATSVTEAVRMAGGVPGPTRYRFAARFDGAEIVIEQPLDLEAPELPPRMTEIELVRRAPDDPRPTITYLTEAPLDAKVTMEASLYASGASWHLTNLPGPTVRLPELPSAFAGFSVEDLTLGAVGATVRTPSPKGEIRRTTANPHVPWVRELPL